MTSRQFGKTIKNLLTIVFIADTALGKRTLQAEAHTNNECMQLVENTVKLCKSMNSKLMR